jgi:hypothetical protein
MPGTPGVPGYNDPTAGVQGTMQGGAGGVGGAPSNPYGDPSGMVTAQAGGAGATSGEDASGVVEEEVGARVGVGVGPGGPGVTDEANVGDVVVTNLQGEAIDRSGFGTEIYGAEEAQAVAANPEGAAVGIAAGEAEGVAVQETGVDPYVGVGIAGEVQDPGAAAQEQAGVATEGLAPVGGATSVGVSAGGSASVGAGGSVGGAAAAPGANPAGAGPSSQNVTQNPSAQAGGSPGSAGGSTGGGAAAPHGVGPVVPPTTTKK